MIHCPICSQRTIGKVGADQYYCWDCCVEFFVRGDDVRVFNVELDGSLSVYGEPQTDMLTMQQGGMV